MSNGYGVAAGQMAISGFKLSKEYVEERQSDGVSKMETRQKPTKKPGFIKRWIAKIAEDAWNQKREETVYANNKIGQLVAGRDEQPSLNRDKAIRFNVYLANGGRVVEVNRYDRKSDRHVDGLYVIANDQDFGREIDKILTMEHLK